MTDLFTSEWASNKLVRHLLPKKSRFMAVVRYKVIIRMHCTYKVFVLVFCVMFVSSVHATGSPFIATKLGKAIPASKYEETNFNFIEFYFDSGINISMSGGIEYDKFYVELEYSKRKFDAGSFDTLATDNEPLTGNQDQTSIFLNGYYYLYKNKLFSTVLGVGLGKTKIEWKDVSSTTSLIVNDSDTVNSYKITLGVGIKITESIKLETDFSRLFIDDITLNDKYGDVGNLNNQDIDIFSVGVRYTF